MQEKFGRRIEKRRRSLKIERGNVTTGIRKLFRRNVEGVSHQLRNHVAFGTLPANGNETKRNGKRNRIIINGGITSTTRGMRRFFVLVPHLDTVVAPFS